MLLFEYQTKLPDPIEDVFALTVNLEKAPRWHNIFTNVQSLMSAPIGTGSCWKINYLWFGSFVLEITDYQPPQCVTFKGSTLTGGVIPNFTIEFQAISEGTQIHYLLHPHIPSALKPIMTTIAPPYGRWDLDRYFRQLKDLMDEGYMISS